MKLLGVLAIPMVMFGSLLGVLVLAGEPTSAQADPFCQSRGQVPDAALTFDAEQLANAATIIEVGRARNVPPQGWLIALTASLQEASLRNLRYGDRDSAGLFQMRPSTGWGSFAQVTDPTYAATAFYGGADVPPANPGLLEVEGWQQMSVAEAAQAVERSAHPEAYEKWTGHAAALIDELTAEVLVCDDGLAGTCPPTGLPAEAGLTADAQLVLRCAVKRYDIRDIGGLATSGHVPGSDHYTGRAVDLMIDDWQTATGAAFGDQVAAYYVHHAEAFGITYVIWRNRIWSEAHPAWRPYSHPEGRTDPTALHMDHLHISVSGDSTLTKEKAQ
jgi:hypothetical protein